jgi:hypothetical protein
VVRRRLLNEFTLEIEQQLQNVQGRSRARRACARSPAAWKARSSRTDPQRNETMELMARAMSCASSTATGLLALAAANPSRVPPAAAARVEHRAWLWVPIVLWAALAQTARNAAQRSLVAQAGTLGRRSPASCTAFPFAAAWVLLLHRCPARRQRCPHSSRLFRLAAARRARASWRPRPSCSPP